MARIVIVMGPAAGGNPTPHDGRYVVWWNPHTRAGTLELISTADISKARRFENSAEFTEWKTVSLVEPVRPWDGRPNRPLTGITIQTMEAP